MICESQSKCKNCHNDFKCFAICSRFIYDTNEDAKDNFELEEDCVNCKYYIENDYTGCYECEGSEKVCHEYVSK